MIFNFFRHECRTAVDLCFDGEFKRFGYWTCGGGFDADVINGGGAS